MNLHDSEAAVYFALHQSCILTDLNKWEMVDANGLLSSASSIKKSTFACHKHLSPFHLQNEADANACNQ